MPSWLFQDERDGLTEKAQSLDPKPGCDRWLKRVGLLGLSTTSFQAPRQRGMPLSGAATRDETRQSLGPSGLMYMLLRTWTGIRLREEKFTCRPLPVYSITWT